MRDILKEIVRLREARSWSEYELSERAGVPQSTISSWYNKNKKPTLSSLEKICNAFDIPLSQLFAENGDPISLTAEQTLLLDYWSYLDAEQRQAILQVMKKMIPKT